MVLIKNKVVDGGPPHMIPTHFSFGQYLIDKLRENCDDRIAFISGETGIKTTYKQITQDVVNMASGLKRLGVKRGDVVLICSENRDEFIVATIAVVCCGGTVTTASMHYTKDEMLHVLDISKPNIICGSQEALQKNISTFKSIPYIKTILQFNDTPVAEGIISFKSIAVDTDIWEYEAEQPYGLSDTVFILYSSGTTGLPKGVMMSQLNSLYMIRNFDDNAAQREGYIRMLTLAPWYHAYGLLSTIGYLTVKKCLVYFAAFHPLKYLGAIQEYQVNVLLVIPPIVVFLAKSPIVEKYDLSSVNMIWCGAAPLTVDTIGLALKRLKNCKGILQAYGMTETSLVATKDLEDLEGIPEVEQVKNKTGSGGVPIRGVKVKVVDIETRQKLGPLEKGEICFKGPIVMKGYVGDEDATREAIDDEDFLKTGDIGYYDEDGYIFVVDRLKELIKYKGHQVAPAVIESVVLQHPAVAECGVVGMLDEVAGQLPTAMVLLKPGSKVTEKELIDFTNAKLSKVQRLYGGVVFVKEIPKNPSGKILRRVLTQQLQDFKCSKL